jgi:hypothetical protein
LQLNEEGNIGEISKHVDEKLNLAGIIIYGENKKVDKAIDKLKFHSLVEWIYDNQQKEKDIYGLIGKD